TALFLGGWNDPFGLIGWAHEHYLRADQPWMLLGVNLLAAGVFMSKVLGLMFVQMWLRWTLPRPRIDQVLYACVKVLLPGACVLLLGPALWQLFVSDQPGVPWTSMAGGQTFNPWNFPQWIRAGAAGALATQLLLALLGVTAFTLTAGWIGYALIGRAK